MVRRREPPAKKAVRKRAKLGFFRDLFLIHSRWKIEAKQQIIEKWTRIMENNTKI